MHRRALSFGSVAAAYERFRPGYPDQLVDEVVRYAAGPLNTALEIGAGTGKATRVFASRGIAVTATDPDPTMLAELRNHVPASVTVVPGGLEDLPFTSTYDLVYAAASLHWTEPTDRWLRVAALVNANGTFACFGGQLDLADRDLAEAVRLARSAFLLDDDLPSPDGTSWDSPMRWPGTELVESSQFSDVRQSVIERRYSMSASDYVGYLSTVSAYLQLPVEDRKEVMQRVLDTLPERPIVVADLTLHLARRRE